MILLLILYHDRAPDVPLGHVLMLYLVQTQCDGMQPCDAKAATLFKHVQDQLVVHL